MLALLVTHYMSFKYITSIIFLHFPLYSPLLSCISMLQLQSSFSFPHKDKQFIHQANL